MKLVDLKSQYRRPKQERSKIKFNNILDYTESLLIAGKLKDLNLNDLAEEMDIAVGSVYHFFPSKNALLLAAADRFLDQFIALVDYRNLMFDGNIECWQDYFRNTAMQAAKTYNTSKPASILLLGQAFNWQIRLADAAGHRRMASVLVKTFNKISDFSFVDNLEDILLNSVVILNGFWQRSYEEYQKVTDKYFEVSIEASLAYLRIYLPEKIALRTKATQSIESQSS